MPERLQLRRTRGWRLPAGARSVARPTRWGNPWHVGRCHRQADGTDSPPQTVEQCVAWHRATVWSDRGDRHGIPSLDEIRGELAGRDLACWCPLDRACHADSLIEAANSATCIRCGDCCERIGLSVATWLALTDPEPPLPPEPGSVSSREFCQEHWTPIARTDETIVVSCDAFDPVERLCTVQETKPAICAGYPYYGRPPHEIGGSERCSYRADLGLPVLLTRKPKL